jgi:hypothetical protein
MIFDGEQLEGIASRLAPEAIESHLQRRGFDLAGEDVNGGVNV